MFALAFSDRDWKLLERLRQKSPAADEFYATLTLGYIAANQKFISPLYDVERNLSKTLLTNVLADSAGVTTLTTERHFQSLFSLRLHCAVHPGPTDALVSIFKGNAYSEWFSKRFLYPFVYYFVNLPGDNFLDLHLSYVMPPGHENVTERAVIRYLLRDEVAYNETLAFKCYIALIAHPFIVDRIKGLNESISAVDMESYGVYLAAGTTFAVNPEVICIKAVADFCDGNKGDELHAGCSYLSAKLIQQMIATKLEY